MLYEREMVLAERLKKICGIKYLLSGSSILIYLHCLLADGFVSQLIAGMHFEYMLRFL